MSHPLGGPAPTAGTAELHATLEQVLTRHFGAPCRVVGLERRPSAYRTSAALEEIEVRLDDGRDLQLMFKDVSRQALVEVARRVKPAFLYNPVREIETYRAILAPANLGTATCYGAVVDPRSGGGRYWLFLERVPGVELYQIGDFSSWQQVARWLARMHARFATETEGLLHAVPLLRYDGDFYCRWLHRAQRFLGRAGHPQQSSAQRRFERLVTGYDAVVQRLLELPVTFIHGEFYASNVLVQERRQGLRVSPVDWEMAAVAPGLIDLAALTSGGWNEQERTALALAYHSALAPEVPWWPAPEALLTALDYCRLHLTVQWLGWAPRWSPPPEHAQDWLGEALRLAEKLRV